jgi:flagellar motor switch protein FliN
MTGDTPDQALDPRIRTLLALEVPLVVRLGERTMRVSEVMSIVPGMLIELEKDADEELEVLVNNKKIGMGNAVKLGENFGIRLTSIRDVRGRLEAVNGKIGA